jgi:hypothetical protein
MAERHVREQEARIAEQREIISTLAAAGEPTVLAEQTLEIMRRFLAMIRADAVRYM